MSDIDATQNKILMLLLHSATDKEKCSRKIKKKIGNYD
jgi:hypothetical protein